MLAKLSALWNLFRKGDAVANPEAWKQGQITATVLTPVIIALARATDTFGFNIPISEEDASILAGGIIVLVNVVLTITTSDKVGLPAKSDDTSSTG